MTIEELVTKILSDSRMHATVAQILGDMLGDAVTPPHTHTTHTQDALSAPSAPVSTSSRKGARMKDYSKANKASVYQVYYYRIKHNQEIEPELDAALRRFFPDSYNSETHLIKKEYRKGGAPKAKASVKPELSRPLKDLSQNAIMCKYHLAIANGEPISDDLHAELVARRIRGYDAATRLIVTKEKKSKRRKPYKECTPAYLRILYDKYTNKADIPQDLHLALIAKVPGYVAKTREIVKLKPGERFATAEDIAEMKGKKPHAKPQPVAKKRPTIASAAEIAALEQDALAMFDADRVAPARVPVDQPQPAAPATAEKVSYPTIELEVTIKPVNMTLDGTYNNVYINGRQILRNHVNTELYTFGDGAFLGIRGIVTDDKELPTRPLWLLFRTDLSQPKGAGVGDKYMGRRVYITSVREEPTSGRLRVDCNNNSITMLNIEREKRLAKGKIFKILGEKTK